MSLVVSDTSPLRALHHLGELDLLHKLYGEVLVPPAVAEELISAHRMRINLDVKTIPFVSVRAPSDEMRVKQFCATLDRGESEAIVLAIEVSADALLIDEIDGRAMAASAGLNYVGVLGILGRAKQANLISDVKSRLDRLRRELQFYISERLYAEFLNSIGE